MAALKTKYLVQDFYREQKNVLSLTLIAGNAGLKKKIAVPEVHRPGLSLSGYSKGFAGKRMLVFGKVECQYISDLSPEVRVERLKKILSVLPPAIIITRNLKPPKEMIALCEEYKIPFFSSELTTMALLRKVTILLGKAFAPQLTVHGTLVEVFGLGVLIKGDSSIGKSEAALGLIERGHRLVSDDTVVIRKCEDTYIEGSGPKLTRHHMEIRGIGLINVAHLYGAVCIRNTKRIEIIVELEVWDDHKFYDRVGLTEHFFEILGLKIPHHVLPVKPGRDVVLLIETIALNYRLKQVGYHSAREFNEKLLEEIARKSIEESFVGEM